MMFIAQDAYDAGVDLEELAVCLLPFGTGNDFCQVMGWGKQPKSIWLSSLRTLTSQIISAQEDTFNVWDIKVTCKGSNNDGDEDGAYADIQQWDSKLRRKNTIMKPSTQQNSSNLSPNPKGAQSNEEGPKNENVFSRMMSNYFSIGVESRVGLGFDKSRTSNAIGNKCVYAWEGIKKMCCCSRTLKMNEVIDYVSRVEVDSEGLSTETVLFASRGSN